VTALAPVIGYDKASKIAHYAIDHDLTLKQAALKLEFVTEAEFDRVVDPTKMVHPCVATEQERRRLSFDDPASLAHEAGGRQAERHAPDDEAAGGAGLDGGQHLALVQ